MTHRYSVALALLLAWLPAAVFAQSIRSFSPALGNAGTLVTLNGTDLDLVAAVAVNGTRCASSTARADCFVRPPISMASR